MLTKVASDAHQTERKSLLQLFAGFLKRVVFQPFKIGYFLLFFFPSQCFYQKPHLPGLPGKYEEKFRRKTMRGSRRSDDYNEISQYVYS